MKSSLFLFFTLVCLTTAAVAQQPIHLIPQPVSVRPQRGVFTLGRGTTIRFNKPEGRAVADGLAQRLNTPTGFAFRPSAGQSGGIQLTLNDAPNAQLGPEGYTLTVTPKGVVLSANQPAGLFYGAQTLLQLDRKSVV